MLGSLLSRELRLPKSSKHSNRIVQEVQEEVQVQVQVEELANGKNRRRRIVFG
jgi:hypothetical protein